MSDAILSNEEVDALLSAIESGQVLVGEQVEQKREKKVQHYDFRRPDRFPREQKRHLQKISEEMAIAIGASFSQYLRTQIDVELIAIEEFSYEVFLNSFTDIVCANVVNLKPVQGFGCLTVDIGYSLAMVDRGLGGPGKIPQKLKPLTIIEEAVVALILSSALNAMNQCWLDTLQPEWEIEKTDTDIRSLQVAHNTESMISINFAISGEIGNGTIILCVPVASLEAMMGNTSVEKVDREEEFTAIKRTLCEVDLITSAILGTTQLLFNDLVNLKPGDVIKMDNKITQEITMEIEDKPKFYGFPGVVGKNMAFKVSAVQY